MCLTCSVYTLSINHPVLLKKKYDLWFNVVYVSFQQQCLTHYASQIVNLGTFCTLTVVLILILHFIVVTSFTLGLLRFYLLVMFYTMCQLQL